MFAPMKYVEKLNRPISRLCFGGAAISGEGAGYGFGEISDTKAIDLLLAAYDSGINIYDFAPIYGFNKAESRAGTAFKQIREKVALVSKCGVDWHPNGRVNMSNAPETALKMLDQSLKNFQSDYIDIYLVHWPDPRVDIRRTLEPLYTAKEKGKIRHLGLCNSNSDELKLAKEVAPIEVIQGELNFWRHQEFEDLQSELEEGVLTMGWGTYDKGILAGTVTSDRVFHKDDCRSWAPWWKKSDWKKRADFVSKAMERFRLGPEELSYFSLLFSQEEVDCSLVGMRHQGQLEQNIKDICAPLDRGKQEILEELEREFSTF